MKLHLNFYRPDRKKLTRLNPKWHEAGQLMPIRVKLGQTYLSQWNLRGHVNPKSFLWRF